MTAGALAAACSLFVDTDGLAGVGAGLDAAGATDGAGDAPFGEDAGDAGSNGDASAGDARC